MNTDKLSVRLETVAKYVPIGAKMADIGSDHAYLPCFLAKNAAISFAVAGEVAMGPLQSAERKVLSEGLSKIISVRLGDGLAVLQPEEVDCITIAGMGGTLITSILEDGKDKLTSVERLILQPNINAVSIRKWFLENSWELVEEEIVEEDGKIYEVLVAEKGEPYKPYNDSQMEMELLFGPILIKRKEEAFKKKWRLEMKSWQRIFNQLESAAPTEETAQKKQELQNKMNWVKGVLDNEDSEWS